MDGDPIEPALVEELRRRSFDYAAGVDRRDRDRFLSAFHPDATLTVVRPDDDAASPRRSMRGHAEIGQVIEVIARYDRTFHFLGQSRYDRVGAGVAGEVWCTAHHRWQAEDELDHVMFIRYTDEYRPGADGRWRIADRTVGVDWSETRVVDVPGATPR